MKIDYLSMIVSFFGFFVGMKFPDWDFALKLRHRSIITHSPFFSIFLLFLYYIHFEETLFRYLMISFSFGIMIHMIFDFFPHGWGSGALLKIPFGRITCSPKMTKYFFLFTIWLEFFIVVLFLKNKDEYFIYSIFGFIYMLYKVPKEKKFWRPIVTYLCFMAFGYLNYIDIVFK